MHERLNAVRLSTEHLIREVALLEDEVNMLANGKHAKHHPELEGHAFDIEMITRSIQHATGELAHALDEMDRKADELEA